MTNEQYLGKTVGAKKQKSRPLLARKTDSYKLPLLLALFHIPFGIMMYRIGGLAEFHQIFIISLGLYWALRTDVRIEKVAMVVAYIIGTEVLWRMVSASLLWELGKYAAAGIMIVALLSRKKGKLPALPLLYLIFLIPGCLVAIANSSFASAKDTISFNMSGPLLLFVSCWFFTNIKLSRFQLKKILFSMILPLMSVAFATLFFTVSISQIKFTGESNFMTSGGFGPNQVSSMLGLGVFICGICFLIFKIKKNESVLLAGLLLLFTVQSMMTFSRGGIYAAIGALALVVLFQLKNLNTGLRKILPIALVGIFFLSMVFPFLNDFTGGKLEDRFEETDSTHRSEIVLADLSVFAQNPILGVGIGGAPEARVEYSDRARVSHTEFSRIFSEHGLLGVLSLISLGLASIYSYRKQKLPSGRAIACGFVVWSSLFMTNAGMRLAAPSFMWGMSFAVVISNGAIRKPHRGELPSRKKGSLISRSKFS